MKRILLIIALFVVWRSFLFLPVVQAQKTLSLPHGFEYTILPYFLNPPQLKMTDFLWYPWANFDGIAYIEIAGDGYTQGHARFFPLYPMLIHSVFAFFPNEKTFGTVEFVIAFVLSNILFLAALLMFYALLRLDWDKKISLLSIVFLLVFPTSFFYGAIYTESLFLLLSVASFYFARKNKWLLAGIFGLLLSATRLVGVMILPALLYEYFVAQKKSIKSWQFYTLFLVPVGLLSFMVYNFQKFGNAILFWEAQGQVSNGRSVSGLVFFPQTIFRYIKILITVPKMEFIWWIALLEFASFCFIGVLLYIGWKKKIRMSYLIFAFLCYFLPASSGTFSGLPRYVAVLFPIFIAIALTKNKWIYIFYTIISIILLFILTMYFSRAYLIA